LPFSVRAREPIDVQTLRRSDVETFVVGCCGSQDTDDDKSRHPRVTSIVMDAFLIGF